MHQGQPLITCNPDYVRCGLCGLDFCACLTLISIYNDDEWLAGGNYVQEVHDYLKSLCADVHVTRGEYDDDSRYPETKLLSIGAFKLGICHGHQVTMFKLCFAFGRPVVLLILSWQNRSCGSVLLGWSSSLVLTDAHAQVVPWGDLDSLAMLQRQLDVDILITGHTHQFKAYKHEGGVIINPGSATGAYSSITYDVNPSFVLMDIDGMRVVVYVYELIDGEVKVDKIDFKKPQPSV